MMKLGTQIHTSAISTLTRQRLCALMDPEDPLGKDWCLLAIKLGLAERIPKMEGATRNRSQTARLLDELEAKSDSVISMFTHCIDCMNGIDVLFFRAFSG